VNGSVKRIRKWNGAGRVARSEILCEEPCFTTHDPRLTTHDSGLRTRDSQLATRDSPRFAAARGVLLEELFL